MPNTKNHMQVSGADKVEYKEWQRFRAAVTFLHLSDKGPGWSWTEVSNRAGKDDRGWAANAMEHRSLVCQKDVDEMCDLAVKQGWNPMGADEPEKKKHPPALKGRMTERAEQYVNALDELKEVFGGSWSDIDAAVGTNTASTSYYRLKAGEQFDVRRPTLTPILRLVAKCRVGEIPWKNGGAPPAQPVETKPQEQATATVDEPAQAEAKDASSMEWVQSQVLELSVMVESRVDRIVAGMESIRDAAPKMLRAAYDDEIKRLRETAELVAGLLEDFD